jgi:predicted nucleotidyltransferase
MILSVYEISIVYLKNINQSIGPSIRSHLLSKLADSKKLYDEIRNSRKVFSSPSSEEEAIKYKNSRKWKIADASFKLFDKYGYLAILKEFIKVYDLMNSSSDIDIEGINDILETIKKYLYNADKLAETEIYEDDKIGGINGISRSDVESDLKYFVEGVLEDNYFDDIEVVEIWLHGSRMRGDFKNSSDLDAVVFYKGCEKEDTIYNILADESYDVMGIEVDFNPIRIDNDNDIKEYKDNSNNYDRKKLGENKQIDEGFKETAASFALSLALLIPGLVSAETLRHIKDKNDNIIQTIYKKENIFKEMLKDKKPND